MQNDEKIKKIGKKAIVTFNNLKFEVFIVLFKNSFGRDRWLVKPVAGSGETWVENVEFEKEQQEVINNTDI